MFCTIVVRPFRFDDLMQCNPCVCVCNVSIVLPTNLINLFTAAMENIIKMILAYKLLCQLVERKSTSYREDLRTTVTHLCILQFDKACRLTLTNFLFCY